MLRAIDSDLKGYKLQHNVLNCFIFHSNRTSDSGTV
jgi:hypothetical protein